ncbi:hypothetical protein ACK30X_11125, partial [Aeromonas caviae]
MASVKYRLVRFIPIQGVSFTYSKIKRHDRLHEGDKDEETYFSRCSLAGSTRVVQGESVNILLNFTQFFETRIEYRFQI